MARNFRLVVLFSLTLGYLSSAHAQVATQNAKAYDPSNVIMLMQKSYYGTDRQERTRDGGEASVRQACAQNVVSSMKNLEEEVMQASDRYARSSSTIRGILQHLMPPPAPPSPGESRFDYNDRRERNFDIAYVCKSLVITGISAQMKEETTNREYFFLWSFDTKLDRSMQGLLAIGCEQRSLDEKIVYASARRCENEPTEACMHPEFLKRAAAVGNMKVIRDVDPYALCGANPAQANDTGRRRSAPYNDPGLQAP